MRSTFAKSAGFRPLQVGFLVAVVVAQFHGVALGQNASAGSGPIQLTTEPLGMTGWRRDPVTITTERLGMTGWWPDPAITITTSTLGMSGWQRDPATITTLSLGMTGWRPDSITVTTEALGMTGWQRAPITVTTRAFGMTGWGSPPEQCSAPFIQDSVAKRCTCPPGQLPSGNSCISAEGSPPSDLRVETEGPEVCNAGKTCPFDILVTNIGAGPFQGPVVVRNEVNLSGAEFSSGSSEWSCAAAACVRRGVTLAPGGSDMLTVNVRIPADAPSGFKLRQCAELKAPEPGDAPVRFVQLMLPVAGIDAGPADNQLGPRTRGAIETFRKSAGLPNGSGIDEPLIAALKSLAPLDPHPENDRECTKARITR